MNKHKTQQFAKFYLKDLKTLKIKHKYDKFDSDRFSSIP